VITLININKSLNNKKRKYFIIFFSTQKKRNYFECFTTINVALLGTLKYEREKVLLRFFFLLPFFSLCTDITTQFFFRHQLAHCILAMSMNVCGQQTKVICKYNNKKNRDLLFDERKRKKEKIMCVCVLLLFLLVGFLFLSIERN